MIEMDKTDRNQYLNDMWLETLLAIIGETLSDTNQVNGAVVQSRRGKDKLSIWLRDATKMDEIRKIGYQYKTVIETQFRMKFQKHDTSVNGSSGRKHSLQI